jgi:hypothetical protein
VEELSSECLDRMTVLDVGSGSGAAARDPRLSPLAAAGSAAAAAASARRRARRGIVVSTDALKALSPHNNG